MKTLLFFLIFSLPLFSMSIKEKLTRAEAGDYIVMKHEKSCTLLHIHNKRDERIVMEEISIPERSYKKYQKGG